MLDLEREMATGDMQTAILALGAYSHAFHSVPTGTTLHHIDEPHDVRRHLGGVPIMSYLLLEICVLMGAGRCRSPASRLVILPAHLETGLVAEAHRVAPPTRFGRLWPLVAPTCLAIHQLRLL